MRSNLTPTRSVSGEVHCRPRLRFGLVPLLPAYSIVALLLFSTPAFAHKLNVFAYVEGASIVGRVYFTGDTAARQTDVIAHDTSGRELGRTKTDDEGRFTLPIREKIDYRLTAETPDGHASNPPFVVSAASSTSAGSVAEAAPRDSSTGPTDGPSSVEVQVKALKTEVDLLREQVDKSEQQLRLRDLLGGVGYILGLAGVAAYLKSRRKRVS